MTTAHYVCFDCGTRQEPRADRIRCDCGGVLDLPTVSPARSDSDGGRNPLPRYWASDWALQRASLGEVHSPLVRWAPDQGVWLKCDHLLPTGSFKDRGARSVVAHAVELGVDEVVVDSSGNAGAALAGHAARAGITCVVYAPLTTSEGKVRQMRNYGAEVTLVPGPRRMSELAALDHVAGSNALYASHATNPYFYDGTKSWFYEVLQQLPTVETVVMPVGSGSLLLGLFRAIDELTSDGWISSAPTVIVAQAEGYASLTPAGADTMNPAGIAEHPIAEGIAIKSPARRQQMLELLGRASSTVSVVTGKEILVAQRELAHGGFYVEPTSAAAWAAWRKTENDTTTVIALTGHGLKTAT